MHKNLDLSPKNVFSSWVEEYCLNMSLIESIFFLWNCFNFCVTVSTNNFDKSLTYFMVHNTPNVSPSSVIDKHGFLGSWKTCRYYPSVSIFFTESKNSALLYKLSGLFLLKRIGHLIKLDSSNGIKIDGIFLFTNALLVTTQAF